MIATVRLAAHNFALNITKKDKMIGKNSSEYRPDIDGLRALAVTLVLSVHAFPLFLRNGYIGVDIFFVISGFLITKILLTQIMAEKHSLLDFYIRRANRIFPCLILVLVTCMAFGWLALYASEFKLLGRSIAAGAGFVANINYYIEGGYWDVSSKVKPLLHLWSLGVEEQFYLLWPTILWTAWARRFKISLVLIICIFASLGWSLYTIKLDQPAAFYLPLSRFWELISGGALAYLNLRSTSQKGNVSPLLFKASPKFNFLLADWSLKVEFRNVASILGLSLIIAALAGNYSPGDFPGIHALLPVLGTVLIIAAGADSWVNSRLFSNKLVVYIGLISYPLYLWHWPLLVFNYIIQNGSVSTSSQFVALALTFSLAILTYHFVEKPIRGNPKWRSQKALVLTALVMICGIAGYDIYANDGFEARYDKSDKISTISDFPSLISSASTLAILGDSQAEMFASAMPISPTKIKIFSTAGWPYLVGTTFEKKTNKIPKLTDDAISNIVSDPTIDIVIITNMYNLYTDYNQFNQGDRFFSYPATPNETSKMAYYAGLRRTAKVLTDAGKKIIYIKSIPFLGNVPSVVACSNYDLAISRSKPRECLTPLNEVEEFRNGYDEALNSTFNGIRNISIFDPMPYLCDNKYCYVYRNNIIMYRDTSHLSHDGAYLVGAEVIKLVNSIRTTQPH
jgi:peptidoglycan/LPS O-acetylase OafA/YrhL